MLGDVMRGEPIPDDGGRGTLPREAICGDDMREFPMPLRGTLFIARPPKFPPFGGRGTDRAPAFGMIRELAFGIGRELLKAGPRFAPFNVGR